MTRQRTSSADTDATTSMPATARPRPRGPSRIAVSALGIHDRVIESADLGDLSLRGISMIGSSHERCGEPRQDSFVQSVTPGGGFIVAVVADGLGSMALSHVGSARASAFFASEVSKVVDEGGLEALTDHDFLQLAADHLFDLAWNNDLGDADIFATTLSAIAMDVRSGPPYQTWIWTCGDSPIYLLAGSEWTPVAAIKEDNTPIVEAWLPGRPQGGIQQTVTLEDGTALVLCTDGIGELVETGTTSVAAYLAESWGGGPPDSWEFARQAAVEVSGYVDDRTALCIWCKDTPPDRDETAS